MNPGDTFLSLSPGSLDHLWIVVTPPNRDNEIAIVNMTTKRADSDLACEIAVGDHPFVQHDTVISYADAQLVPHQLIESNVRKAVLPTRAPVSRELLRRIQYGALASDRTPIKVQDAIRQHLGTA